MTLSGEDRARISAAIAAAEEQTSGEIVCVLARASSDAKALPVFIAAVIALALPWVLMAFTTLSVQRLLVLQILTFVAVGLLLCWQPIRVALVPRRLRRAVAYRAAMEQFFIRGLSRKKDRTGILIFVSLAERYARIVADTGIAAVVPQSDWQRAVDILVAHMREGRIADGFVAAIAFCGSELAVHFPPSTSSSRDELPDRIYVI